MPSGKTHLVVGAFLLLVYIIISIKYLPFRTYYLFVPLVWYIYSLLPDLDSYTGKLRSHVIFLVFLSLIIMPIMYFVFHTAIWIILFIYMLIGIAGVVIFRLRHRGPLHSFWFISIMSIPLLFIHWNLAVMGFIAGSSHLMIDSMWSKIKKVV